MLLDRLVLETKFRQERTTLFLDRKNSVTGFKTRQGFDQNPCPDLELPSCLKYFRVKSLSSNLSLF